MDRRPLFRLLQPSSPRPIPIEADPDDAALRRALLRAFDAALAPADDAGAVSCRLLVAGSRVGCVLGKGGRIVEKIRTDTGAQVRILGGDHLPECAGAGDELIHISGSLLAVKRALLSVSSCLQENIKNDIANASIGKSGATHHRRIPEEDMIFRILCSGEKVGSLIGKGGAIVRTLQNETGASIKVVDAVPDCDERIIVISAHENPELKHSPTQDAVLRVHARLMEAGSDKGSAASARLLVPSQQIGCLLGRGGNIIAEMRRATGASIRIFLKEHVPRCAQPNDEVVQVTGSFQSVQDALLHITGRIRETIFPLKPRPSIIPPALLRSRNEPESPVGCSPNAFSRGFDRPIGHLSARDRQPFLQHCPDRFSLATADRGSFSYGSDITGYGPSSPNSWAPRSGSSGNLRSGDLGGSVNCRGGLSESGNQSVAPSTSVEVIVPQQFLGFIYGENHGNLADIKEISGAKLTIHDPKPGREEGLVIVSGSPDQIYTAQSLLHAFILCGRCST